MRRSVFLLTISLAFVLAPSAHVVACPKAFAVAEKEAMRLAGGLGLGSHTGGVLFRGANEHFYPILLEMSSQPPLIGFVKVEEGTCKILQSELATSTEILNERR